MFELKVLKSDNSVHLLSWFNSLAEAQAWIDSEELQPYWDSSNTYTITEIIPTPHTQNDNYIKYSSKAQSLGSEILSDIFAINAGKSLTQSQFDAMLADATLAKIERCLWNGSVNTAKALILTLDETFFTTAEKNSIVAKIDTFLNP